MTLLLHELGGRSLALLARPAGAVSLTSAPPAADLSDDRVTWTRIAERFTPAWPRLSSPDHARLAIPALQAQLDREWQDRQEARQARPQAFTPGEGLRPPCNGQGIVWSEYNHRWLDILVLPVGLAALPDARGRMRFARHKVAGLPFLGVAMVEWTARLGWPRGRTRSVFLVVMLAGNMLPPAHAHAVANVKEAPLVELSHLHLAVLAVVRGRARWPWPSCLALTGLLLILSREA